MGQARSKRVRAIPHSRELPSDERYTMHQFLHNLKRPRVWLPVGFLTSIGAGLLALTLFGAPMANAVITVAKLCVKAEVVKPLPPELESNGCDPYTMTLPAQPDGVTSIKVTKPDSSVVTLKPNQLPKTFSGAGNYKFVYSYIKNASVAEDPSTSPWPIPADPKCGTREPAPCVDTSSPMVVTNCKALAKAARVKFENLSSSNTNAKCTVTFKKDGREVRKPFTCSVAPGKTFNKTFTGLKKGTKVTVRVDGKRDSAIVKASCAPTDVPGGMKTAPGKD